MKKLFIISLCCSLFQWSYSHIFSSALHHVRNILPFRWGTSSTGFLPSDSHHIALLDSDIDPAIQNPSHTINIDKIPAYSMYVMTVHPEDVLTLKIPQGTPGTLVPQRTSSNAPSLDFQKEDSQSNLLKLEISAINQSYFYIFDCSNYAQPAIPQRFLKITIAPYSFIDKNRINLGAIGGTYQTQRKCGANFFFSIPRNNDNAEYEYVVSSTNPSSPILTIINANGLPDNPFPEELTFKVIIPESISEPTHYSISLNEIGLYHDKPWHIIKEPAREIGRINLTAIL